MIQGDPNQNFRFQMTIALSVCISDPMLVMQKCVWEAVVFYEFQLIFYTCKLWMPKMTAFYIKHHGVMDKALDCHAWGPWFKSYPGYKRFPYFWRNFVIFLLFQNTIFYHKKLPLLKHILALPTWGQKWTQTELQPFEIGNFDLGHLVCRWLRNNLFAFSL